MSRVPRWRLGAPTGLLALLATWGVFFVWIWPRLFFQNETGLYAGSPIIWADWAMHLDYAGVFAFRSPSDWFGDNPFFLGAPFNYHFAADLLSGLLHRVGVEWVDAFVIPSILSSLGLLLALYLVYVTVLRSGGQTFTAVTLFFLNGGLGFLILLPELVRSGELETLFYPAQPVTDRPDQGIHWISIITSQLFPQRAVLLGLPVALLFVWGLQGWYQRRFEGVPVWKAAIFGLASAALYFLHVHSWLALAALCGVFFLFSPRRIGHWAAMLGGAALPAAAIFYLFYHGAGGSGFFEWYPGWLANPQENGKLNLIELWIVNWGLFLPVAVLGAARLRLYRNPLVVGGFVLFAFAHLVKMQPWAWDNTKLLIWAHLLLVIPVAAYLGLLWEQRGIRGTIAKGLAGIILVLLTASGGLDLVRASQLGRNTVRLFSPVELRLAQQLRDLSRPMDVVLNAYDHRHWVPVLTSRPQLMAYPGWLWSWGINYTARQAEVHEMYAGGEQSERLLEHYQVRYVVVGPAERNLFAVNEGFFAEHFPVVLREGDTTVYAIGGTGLKPL